MRGGVFVFANNAIDAPPYNKPTLILTTQSANRADAIPCQTAYPAARQVGQGWSATSNAAFGNPAVQVMVRERYETPAMCGVILGREATTSAAKWQCRHIHRMTAVMEWWRVPSYGKDETAIWGRRSQGGLRTPTRIHCGLRRRPTKCDVCQEPIRNIFLDAFFRDRLLIDFLRTR